MKAKPPVAPAGVALRGTGVCIPPKVVTNDDLSRMVDTNDEWITQRTGIKTRHVVDNGTKTSDLAADAVKDACADAGIAVAELDLLLCATMTQDMVCPATAA